MIMLQTPQLEGGRNRRWRTFEEEGETMTWNFPEDLPEAAWGLIANAWGGNWDDADPEWREAAIRWRDAYHETLSGDR